MKKIIARDRRDPEWIQKIASDISSEETKVNNELLKELFLEYLVEGMKAAYAYRKAKKVAAAFVNKK